MQFFLMFFCLNPKLFNSFCLKRADLDSDKKFNACRGGVMSKLVKFVHAAVFLFET
jgi:hypothetical protein